MLARNGLMPVATARFTPVIVINLLTAGSSIAACAISRSSTVRSSASLSSSARAGSRLRARRRVMADGQATPCQAH